MTSKPWNESEERGYRKSVEAAGGFYQPSEVMYTLDDMRRALATLDRARAERDAAQKEVEHWRDMNKLAEQVVRGNGALREDVQRLREAIEDHSCHVDRLWCGEHRRYHENPHGPTICDILAPRDVAPATGEGT